MSVTTHTPQSLIQVTARGAGKTVEQTRAMADALIKATQKAVGE